MYKVRTEMALELVRKTKEKSVTQCRSCTSALVTSNVVVDVEVGHE